MSAEQENIRDTNQLVQTESKTNPLQSQALDLIFAQNQSGENTAIRPRIGVCPECNPPLDLPQDDPPPQPKPSDEGSKRK